MTAAALVFLLARSACGAPSVYSSTLERAEAQAMAHSPSWAAADAERAAARARAEESLAGVLPRLTLDGYYRYQDEVPSLALAPGAAAKPFGDHRATSLGPSLSWTLWDEGALLSQWRSQKARAASFEALSRLRRRETILGVRLAYFQLQLAREQLALLHDSLALAEAQSSDLEKRRRAGASSRLDALSAHQAALQRRREYLDQQADLAAAWSELAALTGEAGSVNAARPADARHPRAPEGFPEPTLLIDIDALSVSTRSLAAAAEVRVDPEHPRLASYEALADAARLSARAAAMGAWPKVQLSGSVAYQYPNGPVLQSVWQKTVGLSASVPLFEYGRSRRDAADNQSQALAASRRKIEARDGLERDRARAIERLAALETQGPILDRSVAETDEISRLTYSSFLAGRSTFLEVQSANLSALAAKTARARADAQALSQLATLASLIPEKAP